MLEIRKAITVIEHLHREGDRVVDPPIRSVIAAAVLTNPWSGRGYVEDLQPEIVAVAPMLADCLVPACVEAMGGPDNIEAYGKTAVAGLDGEVEHASALIHTLRFGNVFRRAAEGTSFLSFTNKRGPAGCQITFPLVHKTDRSQRSHFLTVETTIADAPRPDEIVVAIGAASSGRPFARIGDRHRDMELGAV
ncbi:amino acid synthesis family protein [Dactylosporangium roseum]|nr:amino acid synthesis family protein [Dactylosporangium roseum]